MKEKVMALADKYFPQVVDLRRQIHANPELSWEEHNTSTLVAEELRKLGFELQTGVAQTGVVAILKCNNPDKKCIALRADMDALPIQEQSKATYCSKNEGKMHACGHDVHTANLLGVAMIMAELKGEIEGSYKFIFQPSEEKIPSGAEAMIAANVLSNPKAEKIFGLHVSPELEVGTVGFCPGKFMASSDEIYLTVKGRGGHAANPRDIINPLLIAAEILTGLKFFTNLETPVVLSFGKIEGKGATNVVPDRVEIAGTLRCFDETLRTELHQKIHSVCESIAYRNGALCEVKIKKGYPVLVNDKELTTTARQLSADYTGNKKTLDIPMRMGSEDFAYYTHHIPACFYRIGIRNEEKGIISGLHTATFDIDEEALKTSTGLMAWIALNA